jgi:hypothetical protein
VHVQILTSADGYPVTPGCVPTGARRQHPEQPPLKTNLTQKILTLKNTDSLFHSRIHPQELGASILSNLHDQRNMIEHSRNTLAGADDNITRARRILSNMTRRMVQNKVIMGGVIAFLILGIALIIWAKVH